MTIYFHKLFYIHVYIFFIVYFIHNHHILHQKCQMPVFLSGFDHSTEATTISLSLLTDRTLALRELEDIKPLVNSGKCMLRLRKYNATLKEARCVWFANCPWRSLTEIEEQILEEKYRRILHNRILRQTILGTAYILTFILGLTDRALTAFLLCQLPSKINSV